MKPKNEETSKVSVSTPVEFENSNAKRTRKSKPFPLMPFEECHKFAKFIYNLGAGQKVRRLTVFEKLDKSPDSNASRALIINSNKYGLTSGAYNAEYLELTPKGQQACNDDLAPEVKKRIMFELAIQDIDIFNRLFEKFVDNKMPSHVVILDMVSGMEVSLEKKEVEQIVDNFIVNLKFLELLRLIGGAERVIKVDHAIENLPQPKTIAHPVERSNPTVELTYVGSANSIDAYDTFDNVCFYISPIGDEGSEFRKHSDLFLVSVIEPALETLGLVVKRADQIDKPGTITKQIIEYIYKSKLVIADLSYHNPNVFYELAVRHMFRLPTVQIIRRADKIPFDLNQSRTIILDTTDIYSLVPRLETYKSEIASQARQALSDPDSVDNPVTNVFPKLSFSLT